jgi:hypothetical protein
MDALHELHCPSSAARSGAIEVGFEQGFPNAENRRTVRLADLFFFFNGSVWCNDSQSVEAFQDHPLGSLEFHQSFAVEGVRFRD